MKIIIVGCGKIGISIIENLLSDGHDIVTIDNNHTVSEDIGNMYDVMTITGNGADCEILNEAGVEKSDLFISTTASDETNMLSCFLAQKMGAKHTFARIRNPEYNDQSLSFIRQQLGLTASLNPEALAAQELFNILKFPAAINIEKFSGGNLQVLEFKLKAQSALDGLSLSELRQKYASKFLICAVKRDSQTYIPDGNFVLKSGDKIGLMLPPNEIPKLLKILDIANKQARNVIIVGASKTAYYLAKKLLLSGNNVKIIDKEENRCREFAALLPNATVICGDGTEQDLLHEENIDKVDAFVSLTGMDEQNILVSMFANSCNVPKVIPKVNKDELFSLAENLGLDTVISPKRIVSDIISRYARALENSLGSNVETLYKLMDSSVEALEFKVTPDFKGLKTPLKILNIKPNILIAGIIRGRKAIIPNGDDEIISGDRVVVVVSGQKLLDLSDIIKKG